MRNLKKFLALVLALMMTFSLMVTVNAADLTDIKDTHDNFSEAVQVLTGMGVIRGYEDGTFKPQNTITRAEAATIVYRLATGDTDDSMAHLFEDSAVKQFVDVAADHWAAGYIGYCVNNGLVVGYDDTHFGPSDKVTGVQVLAMILRAVGYGQNKEFEGPAWATNVYGVARAKGLLTNVDKTSYTGKLTQEAPRELIAELLFQAAQIPTVTYTMLGGYNENSQLLGNGKDNPSLGFANFGLTAHEGIILGNQDTGELYTKIGFSMAKDSKGDYVLTDDCSYVYTSVKNTNQTVSFKTTTGLDMFGHMVKVWYNDNSGANKQTYAVMDEAMSATVYAEDAVLSLDNGTAATAQLGAAAKAAGFAMEVDSDSSNSAATPANTKAMFSEQYNQITTTLAQNKTGNESPVHMYTLISNNPSKTVDVVVILDQEAAQLTQNNTTATGKTFTLGAGTGSDASAYGTSGVIAEDDLVANSHKTLGDLVIATKIQGTVTAGDDGLYKFEKLEPSVTGAVSTYKVDSAQKTVNEYVGAADYVSELTLAGQPTLKRSGITIGKTDVGHVVSGCMTVLETATPTISAGKSYDVYTDAAGRFIGASIASDRTFVYGTYADFTNAQLGEAEMKYYLTGIDQTGKAINNQQIISLDGTPMNRGMYNSLVSIKDFGGNGNQISYKPNAGFMMDKDGNLWSSDLTLDEAADNTATPWTVTPQDVVKGFAQFESGSDMYLVTNDTKFVIVSGHGISQTVEICNGIGELLGNNSSASITYSTALKDGLTTGNKVYYTTRQDIYGNVDTTKNNTIKLVVLSAGNLQRYGTQTLFYSAPNNADTGVNLASEKDSDYIIQLDLYLNGVKGSYFIQDDDAGTSGTIGGLLNGAAKNNGTFLTLIPAGTKDGQQIYTAKVHTGNDVATAKVYTYNYTSSMKTATLANDTSGTAAKVFRFDDAKVTDATYVVASPSNGWESIAHNEFKEVDDINRAVSLKKPDGSGDPVYDVTVAVIISSGVNVSYVYVSNIVAHP